MHPSCLLALVTLHELKGALRLQVQAENVTHAEGLARMATRLEALGGEVEDTRTLLAALQGARADIVFYAECILHLKGKRWPYVSR